MHLSFHLIAQAAILSQAVAQCALTGIGQTVSTKKLVTSDGYTYTYDYVPAANVSRSTVLLLHGFPSSRQDWENTIPALVAEGYGVVAPDLLGFGETSLPTEIEAYNTKHIVGHLAEILDAEGVKEVVGVGHDFGVAMLSKAAAWIPERFSKFVFLTVPYQPAGILFDIDGLNARSLETRGYAQVGYWYFFNSYDAADIMASNLESFFSLLWIADNLDWGTEFAHIGAARAWLAANKTTEPPTWVTPEYEARWLRLFSQPNITISSLNYYKAVMRGIHAPDEAKFTDEDRKLRVPVLAVASTLERVATPDLLVASLEPWAVAGLEFAYVDAGHWVLQQQGDKVNELLIDFIGRE